MDVVGGKLVLQLGRNVNARHDAVAVLRVTATSTAHIDVQKHTLSGCAMLPIFKAVYRGCKF